MSTPYSVAYETLSGKVDPGIIDTVVDTLVERMQPLMVEKAKKALLAEMSEHGIKFGDAP